ncbi:MAG: hypothetical protein K6F99_03735 [Lachnospiraceae bacterium]|nr:hypothetical protein [Lachnospiraceae bacterium]
MAEENNLFRKKSLDRIKSPEHLNDYIRVATPGAWITIIVIALLLLGVLVWAGFGSVASYKDTVITSDEEGLYCYIPEEDIDEIKEGLEVDADGKKLTVNSIEKEPGMAVNEMGEYALHIAGYEPGDWVYSILLDGDLEEGTYAAKIKVYTESPISFLYD